MLKKWLSLCLCVVLILSLSACNLWPHRKTDDPPPVPEDENYVAGMAKLEEGNLTEAYTLLKAATDPKAAEVLEKLVFVPLSCTYKESSASADYTVTYTYDEAGNLLKNQETGKRNWYTKADGLITYTYDEENRLLSRIYHDPEYGEKEVYTYDKDGNQLSYCYYHGDNEEPSTRIEYTYDKRGNLLTETEHDNLDEAYNYSIAYTYDNQDRLIAKTQTSYKGAQTVYTYTYDKAGNYSYSYAYDDKNIFGEVVPMTYTAYYDSEDRSLGYKHEDEQGNIREQEEIRRNENGDETYRRMVYAWGESWDSETVTVKTYNEQGHLLTSQTSEDGEITDAYTYTYDETGNQLTYDYYSGSVSWGRRTCTYDEQGHLLTRQDMGQWGWTMYTLTYDEAGNCIKEEKKGYDSTGTSDYAYDEWGNRTECRYYGDTESGERAKVVTAQWELKYYPEGIPSEVDRAIATVISRLGG